MTETWRYQLFINGDWVDSCGDGQFDVLNPANGTVIGEVPAANAEDARRAVAAARRAFDEGSWPWMHPKERGIILKRLARLLEERHDIFHELLIAETGSPRSAVDFGQCASVVTYAHWCADRIETAVEWTDMSPPRGAIGGMAGSALVREPVGVVAAITAFNFPFFLNLVKVVPALAAGCTVVLKPHPWTPLDAFELARAAADAGLPPGALNVVSGGAEAGEVLTSDPRVDMVAFTGSTATGRRIMASAAGTVKRLQLELGGKSAQVVLDDVSEEFAASIGFGTVLSHCGQVCVNQSRLVLPVHLVEAYEAGLAAAADAVRIGDPQDKSTTLGPLIREEQRARVESYVQAGLDEGARLVVGGRRPEKPDDGYFYEPTVFMDVANDMTIAREEIFGPVLSVIAYTGGDEEAARIANDSIYGLSGGVVSASAARAFNVGRRIRSGIMNTRGTTGVQMPASPGQQGPGWGFTPDGFGDYTAIGGFKQSGIGRELGGHGIEEYTELKAISWG
jgi:acyl-CoA reductase-like NAD-dependent aldehyde dehydrogenase